MEFSFEKEIIESYTRYNYTLYNQWLSAFSRVGNVAQRLRIYHIFSTKLSNRENAEYAIPFVARYLDAFLYSIFPPRNVSLFELNATFSSFFFFSCSFFFYLPSRCIGLKEFLFPGRRSKYEVSRTRSGGRNKGRWGWIVQFARLLYCRKILAEILDSISLLYRLEERNEPAFVF